MSRAASYLNSAKKIIEAYKGAIPFASYLKKYFAENKKHGSKDRKQIASLCYDYFRLGNTADQLSLEDKILLGCFLCKTNPSELLQETKPEWNNKITLPLNDKIDLVKEHFSIAAIFSFSDELSESIDTIEFCRSFLVQPDLFLRIRPKAKAIVIKKIQTSTLQYQLIGEDCLALPNSTKAEDYFTIEEEVVVQDLNSQKTLDYFKGNTIAKPLPIQVWDCCAASGGKSILLFDIFDGQIKLTVSDVRPSILSNLHQRFTKAGIKNYRHFIADLTKEGSLTSLPSNLQPQIILCDVPCTGSGTWSRTPEQLRSFNANSIKNFTEKQKQIVANAAQHLQKNGTLVYITCSVFKKENEDVVDFIKERLKLQLLQLQTLKGYDKRADTMFVAVFKK